ncbi:Protein SMAX1-LIKE 3 [Linum grandiflorum]
MRTGGCTVQQALTPEAANLVKQAVTLARRRGHAQVTPLHVANTMLAASTGILRTACLQSHNHPLQCRALELCFNVALNRLPASTSSGPMLGGLHHQPQYPSISNALVAAFKRAQAHQRRGSIENQQQPLLAVKIELEQLIISILDDPSVSRVMREAGFSSTQVKSNVEQAVSFEINAAAANSNTSSKSKENNVLVDNTIRNEDVVSVIDNLVSSRSTRRGVVVVGECLSTAEGVLKGVMEKVEKGDVPEVLRGAKLVSLPFAQICTVDEVEQKVEEVKAIVTSYMNKGVILNLGDVKWATDCRDGGMKSVEHLIMEIGKLAWGIGSDHHQSNDRFWMVGISTFQTYTKCKSTTPGSHPSSSSSSSLESVWGLHPVTIPAGILRLSLISTDSDLERSQCSNNNSKAGGNGSNNSSSSSWIIIQEGEETKQELNCCSSGEYRSKSNNEGRRRSGSCSSFRLGDNNNSTCYNTCSDSPTTTPTSSQLPAWLQPYKTYTNPAPPPPHQDAVSIKDLCRRWNSSSSLNHHYDVLSDDHYSSRMKTLTFASLVSPSYHHHDQHQQQWPSINNQPPWIRSNPHWTTKTLTPIDNPNIHHQRPPPLFITPTSSTPNSHSTTTPNSTSSSEDLSESVLQTRFKELNSENLKSLCSVMEKHVPWQRHIIPDIASTILQCRSGMVRRRKADLDVMAAAAKEDTWLFFQGADTDAKEKIGRELARAVFGSHNRLVSIALSSFSSTEDCRSSWYKKRGRSEEKSYMERFAEEIRRDPHRVFFVEDVDQADYSSQVGLKRAVESGIVKTTKKGDHEDDEVVGIGDAIVILSCESFSSRSRGCSPTSKHKVNDKEEGRSRGVSPCGSLDLNICLDDNDDDDNEEDKSIDDLGLLESVDRRIVFKLVPHDL